MDRKIPLSICSEIALPFCGLVVDDHCSTWYERSAGVAHGASESHRCWLSGRASAEREYGDLEQGAGRVNRDVPHHLVPPIITKAGRRTTLV